MNRIPVMSSNVNSVSRFHKDITLSQVAHDFNSGGSCTQIASKYSVSAPTAWQWLDKAAKAQLLLTSLSTKLKHSNVNTCDLVQSYLSGKGILAISKEQGAPRSSVQWALYKAVSEGAIPEELLVNRVSQHRVVIPESKVIEQYRSGMGLMAIAKGLDVNLGPVRRILARNKVIDSSRGYRRTIAGSTQRRFRHLFKMSVEFKTSTKRQCFEEKNHFCQWCGKEIVGSWRVASYHHKLPVFLGGTNDKGNCIVLHSICHIDNFYQLHGCNWLDLTKDVFRQSLTGKNLDLTLAVVRTTWRKRGWSDE